MQSTSSDERTLGQIEGVDVRLHQSDEIASTNAFPILLIPGALTDAKALLAVVQPHANQCLVAIPEVSTPEVWNGLPFDLNIARQIAEKACHHLYSKTGQLPILVGESAGALIGLRCAQAASAPIKALILIDPPLAPAKLWHIRSSISQAVQKSPPNVAAFIESYAHALFGFKIQRKDPETELLYHEALRDC